MKLIKWKAISIRLVVLWILAAFIVLPSVGLLDAFYKRRYLIVKSCRKDIQISKSYKKYFK